MKTLQIEQTTAPALLNSIREIVKQTIKESHATQTHEPQTEFITRLQVATLFDVTLPTVHNWTKAGLITPYKMGTRIYFKKSEILETPQAIKRGLNAV